MVAVASPILLTVFGCIVMYLLLGVDFRTLPRKRKVIVVIFFIMILFVNIVSKAYLGRALYAKFYVLFAQIPVFLLFYLSSTYRGIKLLFVLLTTIKIGRASCRERVLRLV